MIFSLSIRLTAVYLLAITLQSVQSNTISSLNNTDDVTTTVPSNYLEPSKNATTFQTTEYAIVDFAKLGYKLFKEKLFSALTMLDNFMQMKPIIVKVTRTFIFGNETEQINAMLNEMKNKSAETADVQPQEGTNKLVETNTVSPLENDQESQLLISEPIENLKTDTEYYPANENSDHKIHENVQKNKYFESHVGDNKIIQNSEEFKDNDGQSFDENNDIKITKVEKAGFFGSVISAVGHFFQRIWNWFT